MWVQFELVRGSGEVEAEKLVWNQASMALDCYAEKFIQDSESSGR